LRYMPHVSPLTLLIYVIVYSVCIDPNQ
jgi:hypothetical protein